MVGKPPLMSMVLRWFLVSKTIGSNGFPMVFGPKTIVSNCFSNGFWSKNHWYQWFFNGFVVRQPLDTMVFQWFPMVANHWSKDWMVTIHRSGLAYVKIFATNAINWVYNYLIFSPFLILSLHFLIPYPFPLSLHVLILSPFVEPLNFHFFLWILLSPFML